ncbi:hypothetical protein KR222_002210 [Zaprionus bogoriensis]|nr:hypothetical protein KR222_002210 [Zaprionus bogoriensis]
MHNNMNLVLTGPLQSASRSRTLQEQKIEAHWVSKLDKSTLYLAHGNWMDFSKFRRRKPIYLSMVRDPLERIIESFYARRTYQKFSIDRKLYEGYAQTHVDAWYKQTFNECVRSGNPECRYIQYSVKDDVDDFKRQSLFFCGNHEDCLPFNSPYAVQMAKRNVEQEYSVVGTWEHVNLTLTVLEKYVPRYFNHARYLYKLHKQSFVTPNRRYSVDDDVRATVRRNFTHEYDFYYFCKQRLYKQYMALKLEKNLN